jgi:hypothetical protein
MKSTILVMLTIWLCGCSQPAKPVATPEQRFQEELEKTLSATHSAEMTALDRQAETLARIESEVLRLAKPRQGILVENHDTVEQPELWIPPQIGDQVTPQPVDVSDDLEQFFRSGFDELSERLQKLEIGLEQVQTPEPKPVKDDDPPGKSWSVKDFVVVKIEQPGCPPCRNWSKVEKPRMKCGVNEWDHTKKGRPQGVPKITGCPCFALYASRGGNWELIVFWPSYTNAATINSRVDAEIAKRNGQPIPRAGAAPLQQVKPVSNRNDIVCRGWSQSALREWCRQHYTPQTQLMADVAPRSYVWDHLVWHGLTRQQVSGLPQWEALAIHDALHAGRLVP